MKGKNQRIHLQTQRQRRRYRVRNKLHGTPERPRLVVYRSLKHIYAQVVNDEEGQTLASAGTLDPEFRQQNGSGTGGNKTAAAIIGRMVAERAKAAGIDKVCFDRRSYRYHGRVQSLADAAREAGLQF